MYYGASGLGQIDPAKSTIRWWCWDYPGFKECHAKQWEKARAYCQQTNSAGYVSMDVCQNKETDFLAKANCECPDRPPQKGEGISTGTYLIGAGIIAVVGLLIYRDQRSRGGR